MFTYNYQESATGSFLSWARDQEALDPTVIAPFRDALPHLVQDTDLDLHCTVTANIIDHFNDPFPGAFGELARSAFVLYLDMIDWRQVAQVWAAEAQTEGTPNDSQ